jgi:hypothetical protein
MFYPTVIEDEFIATKKVVSYTVWGNNPMYINGVIRQADFIINDSFFHDWECWVYHDNSLSKNYLEELQSMDPEKIKLINLIDKYPYHYWNNTKYMWRFLPIDDPEVFAMISRDADSIITEREKKSIEVWLKSGKQFHIMRDHPAHVSFILAGMWGMRKFGSLNRTWSPGSMETLFIDWLNKNYNRFNQNNVYGIDEAFLRDCIYPLTVNDRLIHDEIIQHEGK